MTETTYAPDPPPAAAPTWSASLVRPREGRVLRGVAAGLGRATGTDPVLWRVLLVVLAFFGGLGVVLYLIGWILMAEAGSPPTRALRLLRGEGTSVGGVLTLGGLAALLLISLGTGQQTVPLVLAVGLLAFLLLRQRAQRSGEPLLAPLVGTPAPAAPGAGTSVAGEAATASVATPAPVFAAAPAAPPPPPKPRSRLGLLTLSAGVLVLGGLTLAAALGADGISSSVVLATTLLVVGSGLLLGAVWGRSRWLIVPAVLLALLATGSRGVEDSYGTAVGDPTWVVQGTESHRVALGEPVLDLRSLDAAGAAVVQVRLGAGSLTVLVPQTLAVSVVSDIGLGQVRVLDEVAGTSVSEQGVGLVRTDEVGTGVGQAVRLEIRVGLGEVEVRRVAAA